MKYEVTVLFDASASADIAAADAALEAGPQPGKCPTCGSDCNERDELIKAEREIEKLRTERDELQAQLRAYLRAQITREEGLQALIAEIARKVDRLVDTAPKEQK